MDGLGNPLYFKLSGGQVADAKLAIDVLKHVSLESSNVIGDRAYGSETIRFYIRARKGTYTIPPKKNVLVPWDVDWWVYKERHLVECFFNKLKQFRHIATRYDKLALSYLAFVHLAAIFILTK